MKTKLKLIIYNADLDIVETEFSNNYKTFLLSTYSIIQNTTSVGAGIAGELINPYTFVSYNQDGLVVPAVNSELVLGITTSTIQQGQPVAVRTEGELVNPGWNLEPNKPIYVGADGQITQDLSNLTYFIKAGVATHQTRIFLQFQPKDRLEQSLNDVLIQTISNISAASGTFELLSQTPVSIVEENQKLEIQQSVQSSDGTIFQIDELRSSIKITKDLPFTVISNIVVESVGTGELTITFIDKDTQAVLSNFTKTINNQLVEINQSSLINVGRFLTPAYPCNVEIVITCTCESCTINKFTGIIIASFGSGKVITTNPLPIVGNAANIGYNINGDIVLNTALVFLDLTEDDFDINGKLINNRNYLIEEHYGVIVDGSYIMFDTDLTDKYTVISHAQ
jgi:hypothetical protein